MQPKYKFIYYSMFAAGLLTACGGSDSNKDTTTGGGTAKGKFTLVQCENMLEPRQLMYLTAGSTCGYLTVPEKHALYGEAASTTMIDIAVIKLASSNLAKKNDPVLYLQGGPGGSGHESLEELVKSGTFHNDRDVYLVDQRGTGYSKPVLLCSEFSEAGTPAQVKACKQRLESSGIDISAYHSVHNAHDIIALRKALHIKEWNIYGISYGTRLATTIMREDSKGIRSVILDGMFPVEVNGISDTPWANYESLNQIVENCDNTQSCSASEFKEMIEDIIARMHNAGMFDESREFINNLLELGTEPSIINYLLAVNEDISIYASILEESDLKSMNVNSHAFSHYVDASDEEEEVFYNGMGLSTICAEEYPFLGITALSNDNSQGWSVSTQTAVDEMHHMGFDKASCQAWNVKAANTIETQAVSSNLPVLILNGDQDTQTPSAWGELVAKNMPNSQSITNPQGEHGQLFSNNDCFETLAKDFLAAPNQPLDKSCVDAILPLTYSKNHETAILEEVFAKKTVVFGVPIYATEQTPDEKVMHAANIMAQYLDNNEDGKPDNPLVVEQLIVKNAALVMAKDEDEIESLYSQMPESELLQDLYASEVVINPQLGQFDASIEEVLHLITHVGYGEAYPNVFGERVGTEVANAMDVARGGQFENVPEYYPESAWFTFDDETCDYKCMVTEYVYWSLTSLLGAQQGEERLAEIIQEWQLNTRDKVAKQDSAMFDLLTHSDYHFATVLPDGNYTAQQFNITNTDSGKEKEAYFTFKTGEDSTVYMNGFISSNTLTVMQKLFNDHPQIDTIVMENVPGSADDEVNLLASMEIRNRGIATHIPANGMVASGGTDMFLAGVKRTISAGAKIGVHSWRDSSGKTAVDYPRHHETHEMFLTYYQNIGINVDFYWYSIEAAPAESIHWMTAQEMALFEVLSQ